MKKSASVFACFFVMVFVLTDWAFTETRIEFFPAELANPADVLDVQMADELITGELISDAENEGSADEEIPSLDTIQDYWNLYEVSDSFRERFRDGELWGGDEDTLFFLYHLHERIRLERLESWAFPASALTELDTLDTETEADALNARRFDPFWISGRLLSAERTEIEESVAYRYRVASYYTCRLVLDDGRKVTLFCQQIPRALQKTGVLDGKVENAPKVGVIALFLKKGVPADYVKVTDVEAENVAENVAANAAEKPAEMASLYMVARRLAWYPDTLLGNAGMDYGLYDDLDSEELAEDAVRSASVDTRLSLRNRECFYQQMATVFRVPAERLRKIVADVQQNAPESHFEQLGIPLQEGKDGKLPIRYSSVVPLFNQPVKERGNFFYLKGVARRIVPIRVEDEDINNRLGITHYYEIFIFPDEAPQSPVAVLVPELPPGVEAGNHRGYYVELAVPAFFFNTWSFIKGTNEEGKPIRHLIPLLIGGVPETTISTVYTPDMKWFYVIGGTVFGGMFLFSIVFYLVSARVDRECSRKRQEMNALPAGSRFENDVQHAQEAEEESFDEWCRKNEGT